MYLKPTVKKLAAINGASGNESAVREAIIKLLPKNAKYTVDNLGNLIVEKKGGKKPKNKIMIAAHMDEVGFIARDICEDGTIAFAAVGGVSASAVFGRQLVFENGVHGAVAGKPIHLLKDDERDTQPKIDDLRIDIGASDKDEAAKLIDRGDYAYFIGEQTEFGDGSMMGKALDDRAGCGIMLILLEKELPFDCTFVFTVQEEVGCRGAAAAAFTVDPDIALILEATTACDINGSEGEKKVCVLGEGPVVSFMDRSTIYDRELYKIAFDTAKRLKISCQTKTAIAGGNDGGAVHKAAGGVRTLAVSVPCRYLHTASCVIKEKDLKDTAKLAEALIGEFGKLR